MLLVFVVVCFSVFCLFFSVITRPFNFAIPLLFYLEFLLYLLYYIFIFVLLIYSFYLFILLVLFTVVTLTQDAPKPLMNKTLYNTFHS